MYERICTHVILQYSMNACIFHRRARPVWAHMTSVMHGATMKTMRMHKSRSVMIEDKEEMEEGHKGRKEGRREGRKPGAKHGMHAFCVVL
jgi:hypothetical protein